MQTEVVSVDPVHPDMTSIERAAELLCAGEVVVFPTETVYGLGADAFQARAVERIFAAKGRPFSDPLIVHIAEGDALQLLSFETIEPLRPERIDRIGKQQHFDILRPEAFQLRRGTQRLGVVASQIIDRVLADLYARQIIRQRRPAILR